MKKNYIILGLCVLFAAPLFPQQADTAKTASQQSTAQPKKPTANNVYYGGTVGLSFGDYFRINVSPLIGYKVGPQASVGARIAYEYIEDKRYSPKLTSSNYGGSIFSRYRLHAKAYAHGEFAYMSYKYKSSDIETNREWVPFLLLGGGLIQPVSPRASLIVEVLVDVLQDSSSPYEKWSPLVSVGIAAGF